MELYELNFIIDILQFMYAEFYAEVNPSANLKSLSVNDIIELIDIATKELMRNTSPEIIKTAMRDFVKKRTKNIYVERMPDKNNSDNQAIQVDNKTGIKSLSSAFGIKKR